MEKIKIYTDCSFNEKTLDMYIGFIGYIKKEIAFYCVEKIKASDYDKNNNIGEIFSIYKCLLFLKHKKILNKYIFDIYNDNLHNIKCIENDIETKNNKINIFQNKIKKMLEEHTNININWIKSINNLAHNIIVLYKNIDCNIFEKFMLNTNEESDPQLKLKTIATTNVNIIEKTIRERTEITEKNTLSNYATLSLNSKGRYKKEPLDNIRTCFAIDRDRIIHCNAFKRLKGKTQVFINPSNDHFENRLTHTLETAQIARTIAKALNLNLDLTEAILLGHDIGHTPFGHLGEEILNEKTGNFTHEIQSVKILQKFEKNNKGLNLTKEVLDGILNHSGLSRKSKASTVEGQIAMYADKIAYLTSDLENAIKLNIISKIPCYISGHLGDNKGQIIDSFIKDIIYNSYNQNEIMISDKMFFLLNDFRNFMFENVYYSKFCNEQRIIYRKKFNELYDYFYTYNNFIPAEYKNENINREIADYMSTMTERYMLNLYNILIEKKGV